MKKNMKKIISIILTVAVFITGTSVFASANDSQAADNSALIAVTNAANGFLNVVFKHFGGLFSNDFQSVEDYYAGESENFYEGNETFLDEPAQNAKWYLGFAKTSIVPESLKNGEKSFYTGGYFTQTVNGVFDDQGVNAIALSDNSGRGTVIMAAVDGVGVTNSDVRAIRAEAERKLAEQGVDSDIVAININSTHCHTVLDTQGFGLMPLIKGIVQNIAASFTAHVEKTRSIDPEFYDYMIDGASDAIAQAYMNMESGELYYFETAGIGYSERNNNYLDDEYGYIYNKRYDSEGYQHVIACFRFVPDNTNSAPTVFANLGGHPTTINRSTKLLSADYPHYIETKLNDAGMNFMFIQGAQSPISVSAGSVETEEILAEVEAEIEANEVVNDYAQPKKLGYEFARLIIEAQKNATAVAPVLNVKMSEVTIQLEYGLLELGAVSGLLGTTTVRDASSSSGYSIISEVGYIEIGTDLVLLTVPGELVPQLVYGNVVDKTEAYLGTDWEYECTSDIIGEDKTVLVMGLCNDAIGYIVPDNDYAPFIADTIWNNDFGAKLFGEPKSHYEEMLSTSSKAGSTVIVALNELVKEYK
ncbi:MAG: hypothetical protein IKV76_01525 [Clostridia bacterium]|nr:hypothetical protein [Clostridia bacterium]